MRNLLACVSLAALLATGCDKVGGGGSGGGAAQNVQVDPKAVTASDLQAAVSDPRVKQFYQARGWTAVWTGERAKDLTAAFADADRHAIDSKAFIEHSKNGSTAAEREAGLTLAAIDYAQALASGAIDPRKVFEVYTVPLPKTDVLAGLNGAVERGNVREWLASLAPQDEEYKALSDAYVAYRQKAAQEQRQSIAVGEQVKPGKKDPRIPQIRQALVANGYLATPQAPPPAGEGAKNKAVAKASTQPQAAPSTAYGTDMVAAIRRVQADYGIEADGVIGNSTLEALNTGARDRARILAVNLERRRWLERDPPKTRIDVNTAAAELSYFRDGNLANKRRVVVGQPEWETPELASPSFPTRERFVC
jgi:murein L,D-transpeptidase YcbB/YkuD